MHTLRNAKIKYEYPMESSHGKEDGYFQTIELDTIMLPEISYWQVGEEYTLVIKVKESRHEVVKNKDSVKEKASFEILEVGSYDHTDISRDKVKSKLGLK